MTVLRQALTWGVAAVIATVAFGTPAASAAPATISLTASSTHLHGGQPVTIRGSTTGVPAGTTVDLYQSGYPYTARRLAGTSATTADGSFAFAAVMTRRDTRYEATLAGTAAHATIRVNVIGKAWTQVRALKLGRARVTVVAYHAPGIHWGGARVHWSFAPGYRGKFKPSPATRTIKRGRYADVLSTTVALPAGHFRWRACFTAPGDHALGDPRRPPGCTGRGYHGAGSLPFGFPSKAAIVRAEAYLGRQGGHNAIAVVTTEGREYGLRMHDQFITGSVVKAMLLVAYLRHLDATGQHYIDSYSNSFLYPMIHVSDNDAATECWSIVGDSGLYALARAAGMTDFSVPAYASWGGEWGTALLSAADQAKFFFEMDSLIPPEFVGYARNLLSTVVDYESWGIPAIARPRGYTVFFKGGWRPSPDTYLVHQIARLEGHGHVFSLAVMTDGDSGMGDGIAKIQGATAALLG